LSVITGNKQVAVVRISDLYTASLLSCSADMASVAYWQVYSGLLDPFFGVVPSLWVRKRSKFSDARLYTLEVKF
jgi:hypothetical protein